LDSQKITQKQVILKINKILGKKRVKADRKHPIMQFYTEILQIIKSFATGSQVM
jgi:hypothetical protein